MEKEFAPYELAVKLKELGFDEPCLAYFKDDEFKIPNPHEPFTNSEMKAWFVSAPLWQQAFDWFRDVHNLSYCVAFNGSESYYWWITECKEFGVDINSIDELDFETYQEARKACLEKLIGIITPKA